MKLKHLSLLCCLLWPIFSSLGQNLHLIDSIKQQLKQAKGEKRFNLLNSLAWEYRFSAPDSTVHYGNLAYTLGEYLKLSKGLAQSLNYVGVAFNYKGQRLTAFRYYKKALQKALIQGDSLQVAHANNNIGRLFYEQGVPSRSYDYFMRAKSIFQHMNDSSGLAYVYQSLANLYTLQGDYKKAEENFLEAYAIRLALGDSRNIMSAQNYLGRLYQESNQLEKSIYYLQLADSIGHVINDEINLAQIKVYMAESYLLKGLLDEAEKMCHEGLDVVVQRNNVRMLPYALVMMGRIMFERKDLTQAKNYFNKALTKAAEIKDLNSQMNAYYYLWRIAEKSGSEIERLRNLNQYLLIRDSTQDIDFTRQVERLKFEIEIQRKEQENELLKVNNAKNEAVVQQQQLQNIVLVVIIVFITVLVFLQRRNAIKLRDINTKLMLNNEEIETQRGEIISQNEELSMRNAELSELNHEKDTLMSIVAHDLKSPLNRIKGMLDLIELGEGLTENQKTYIKLTKDATHAGLNLINGLLDVNMLEGNIKLRYSTFNINKFLTDKIEAFLPIAKSKNIHLQLSTIKNHEVYCDQDYLNRIMDNLISNAIKFSKNGSAVVVSAGNSADAFWISVKDQGQGFSDTDKQQLYKKFKKLSAQPTGGETSNGLGLAIVKTLVDRLHGSIELISERDAGSEFIIKIPSALHVA